MLATRQNLKVSMFKNLKTLDPRFREGDEGDVAGMTESVWLRQISRSEIIPAFYCCPSSPDLAKRNHSRVFSVIPLPLSVIPAKAGIQSPLSRKTQKQKSLKVRGINNQ